jgi:hypothetical protein
MRLCEILAAKNRKGKCEDTLFVDFRDIANNSSVTRQSSRLVRPGYHAGLPTW